MRNVRALELSSEPLAVADSVTLDMEDGKAFSLIAWVKFSAVEPCEIMNKGILSESGYVMEIVSSTGFKLRCTLLDADLTDALVITGSTVIANGVWYLCVFTFDGTSKGNLYINGASVATEVTQALGSLESADELKIAESGFKGSLGEIQIVKGYALKSGEISDLYVRGTSKGLKASYGGGDVTLWGRWKNRVLKDNSDFDQQITSGYADRTDRKRIKGYR